MNESQHFEKVRDALEYIQEHFQKQPDLDTVAKAVNMSPDHFQRIFSEWAGVSPKKFLQYLSLSHAKELLKKRNTLETTSLKTGLSGTGRLHDLFVQIEGMTPGEYKNGGENLVIEYSFHASRFGILIIASTPKGVCFIGFGKDQKYAVDDLIRRFPNAGFEEKSNTMHTQIIDYFSSMEKPDKPLHFHLHGTPFQIKVWEALLTIPEGGVSTYGALAEKIGNPKASRAVGTAVGANPISILIPCHRVIQSSGVLGNYHWGSPIKYAILGWESAQTEKN